MSLGITVADCVIILLYTGLVAGGLRWKRRGDDAAFIGLSVKFLIGLGLAWGVLVNLFALNAKLDQQGILIGLIMALALAGLAYWQRSIAETQRAAALEQRNRALITQSRFLVDRATRRSRTAKPW